MSGEFAINYESGNTLYDVLRNAAGKVLDATVDPYHSANSWVNWNVANVDDYDLAMVDKNGDLYVGDMPSGTLLITDADVYKVQTFLKLGANPADGDDLIGGGLIDWSGTAERLPAMKGSEMNLADDAVTAAKYDEATAFPVSERQSKAASTMELGLVVADGGNSTTQFKTDLAEATDDHFNGRIVIFLTGAMLRQASDITDYDGTNKIISMTAMTEIPSAGAEFIIV